MLLVKIFCEIDDFSKQFHEQFKKNFLTDGKELRNRSFIMTSSEIMTIAIYFHFSGYKTFKDYYEKSVLIHLNSEFPNLVSYNRFLELRKNITIPLAIFAQLQAQLAECTGVSFIDSFSLKVSHQRRIYSHKVFKGIAQRGKTSVGWFYGFKLHVVINHFGEIISFYITPGNVSDNNEKVLNKLTQKLFGKLYGDKGYILRAEIFEKLYLKGVHLVTKLRKNMKNKLILLEDKIGLKKRGVIESVGAILKEDLSLEHSRHRSVFGFMTHVVSTLVAYSFRDKKPQIATATTEIAKIC